MPREELYTTSKLQISASGSLARPGPQPHSSGERVPFTVVLHITLLCVMVSLGDFSMPVLIFTEGIVKKIIRVVLSLLEEETRQGRHQRPPPPGRLWPGC